jgi:Protein of unknown function (DUF3761)
MIRDRWSSNGRRWWNGPRLVYVAIALTFALAACGDGSAIAPPPAEVPTVAIPVSTPTPARAPIPLPTRPPAAAPTLVAVAPAQDPMQVLRAQGISAICNDGTPSFSQSRRGTCSHHGGVSVWTGLI